MPCLCDFCSAADPVWRHPARNFIGYVAGGVVGESVGDWAACQECHRLIVSGRPSVIDRNGRSRPSSRSTRSWEPFRTQLATEMGMLHAHFFENRTGPASAII